MMRMMIVFLFVFLAGCQNETTARKVDMYNGSGDMIGTAAFSEGKDGVNIKVKVTGLKPGPHGIHIHEIPSCKGPDFKSAGNHLNPEGKKHGLMNQDGAHLGDLPNIQADGSGKADANLTVSGATMKEGKKSLLNKAGSSIVITDDPDDGMTEPSGDSGQRIACGELNVEKNKKGKSPSDPTDIKEKKQGE